MYDFIFMFNFHVVYIYKTERNKEYMKNMKKDTIDQNYFS